MSTVILRRDQNTTDPFAMSEVKSHLRVTHDDEDFDIHTKARTSALEFEQFAQMALLDQTIKVRYWRPLIDGVIRLPIGPVTEDATATVTADGVAWTGFDLIGGHRPVIFLPDNLIGCRVQRLVVEYTAGFGTDPGDIPADIAEAIMDQTALHFDARSPMGRKELTTSPHMMRIAARYRGVQV